MNRVTKNKLESLERADQFLTEHPLTPANARVTALIALLQAVILVMTGHRNGQDFGLGKKADGTASKAEAAVGLRGQMRRVSKIAKELDPVEFPGVRQTLRMPERGYQAMQARAETFVTAIAPIKVAFVERGLPADFDVQLQAALAVFIEAVQRQTSGRAQHIQGTAGLEVAGRQGRKIVREIDAILHALYEDEPELYAAWKSTSRVMGATSSPVDDDAPTLSSTLAAVTV